MEPSLWTECFSIHMQHAEHITLLEGRGVVAALRHKFRSVDEFGKAHLHLNDNMSIALLMSKGRSSQYSMLRVCRRVACLLLATDSFLAVRWIPSERNVADRPSRKWEHLRREDALSRSQKDKIKEGILDVCYPCGSTGHSSGWFRHAHLDGPDPQERDWQQETKSGESHSRTHSAPEDVEAAAEGRSSRRWSTLSRPDSARDNGGFKTCGDGLSEEDHRAEAVCQKREAESDKEVQLRLGLLQVCQQHVQPRLRIPGRVKDFGRHHRQLSRLRPSAHVVPNPQGPSRLAKSGATTDQAPLAVALDSDTMHGASAQESAHHSLGPASHVHSLPQTRGNFGCPKGRPHPSYARQSSLCTAASSCGSRSAVQGGAVGRVSDVGLTTPAMVGKRLTESGLPPNISPGPQLRPCGEELEMGAEEGGLSRKSCSVIPDETFRAQPRSSPKTAVVARSQAARKMGVGSQRKTIRSTCKDCAGVPQPPSVGAESLPENREDFPQGGPKVFPPEGQALASTKKYVLEIFSGCARLSRACSRRGFFCIAYDIEYGNNCDLLNSKVFDSLVKFIQKHSHEIALVWFGTPCTTWSRARKYDGGPRPLRDDGIGLMGLSDLSAAEHLKVDEGNKLLLATVRLCELCLSFDISWIIENPFSSRIWLTRQLQFFLQHGAHLSCADFCAYGMPWKKSTGFLVFGWDHFKQLSHVCQPVNGRCQYTGRKHIILTGKDASGLWMTRRAQPYPLRLCAAIAQLLRDTISD